MFENELILEQRQVLSANQAQSLEILSFTNQELNSFLTNEYLENPMLDNSFDKEDKMLTDLEQMYEKAGTYNEHFLEYGDEDNGRQRDVRAKEKDEIEAYLLEQLRQEDISAEEWKIIHYLIQCLDEKGFFTWELSVIAKASGFDEDILETCLNMLKGLEPAGIFSSDITECLQCQLNARGETEPKLMAMAGEYFPYILRGQIGYVSRKLKLSTVQVKEYIHLLGTLNPRPIMNIQNNQTEYVVPDILASREKDEWQVELNDGWMGEYRFSEYYLRMMKESSDDELKEYFREKLKRARFVLNCVEQRRKTIIKITKAILDLQKDYFLENSELNPVSMEDVAEIIGMHVSTVSRAVKGKYLQYRRTVPLKDLFVVSSLQQKDISTDKVKRRLAELVKEENASSPLSDRRLAEILENEGIHVSRRVIAKYRGQMGIPDSRERLYL